MPRNTHPQAVVIGVMGPGESATEAHQNQARAIGQHIATRGWVLLTGGRNCGVMRAASEGATQAGGLTIALLPGNHKNDANPWVHLALPTGMGNGRNHLNVLASDVIVVCGLTSGAGTLSEAALALKSQKPLIILTKDPTSVSFLRNYHSPNLIITSCLPETLDILDRFVQQSGDTKMPLSITVPQ